MSDYPKEVVEGALQTATKRNMELYAEVERLRAALKKIAGHEPGITEGTRQMIALQALNPNIKPGANEQLSIKEGE